MAQLKHKRAAAGGAITHTVEGSVVPYADAIGRAFEHSSSPGNPIKLSSFLCACAIHQFS